MEPLDEKIADALADAPPDPSPPRVLVVQPDAAGANALAVLLSDVTDRCTCVTDAVGASEALGRTRFDVVICDARTGLTGSPTLLRRIAERGGEVGTIVTARADSFRTMLRAVREGAGDFVNIARDAEDLPRRVEAAAEQARSAQQLADHLDRLKRVCSELNVARHEIAEQIDVLCSDLATAYKGMTEQMTDVAMASEFRALIRQELDIEDLLRTTLEYLLTKTGPTNAAVFLPDGANDYGLGAYVNYDCPRESISLLLDQLGAAVCPRMEDDEAIHSFGCAGDFASWADLDAGVLESCEVLTFTCRHEGEPLAVVILFRDRESPFDASVRGCLETLRPIFAEQLHTVIKVHHRAESQWPSDASCEDDLDWSDDFGMAA